MLITVGVVVAFGWFSHSRVLVEIQPGWASMKFNTALCFFVLGVGALAMLHEHRTLALISAGVVFVIGSGSAAETFLGVDLKLDQFLIAHFLTSPGVPPGRMSPISAVLFSLASANLAYLAQPRWRCSTAVVGLSASVVAGVASAAFIGYLTQTPAAYGWGLSTSVAAHTAFSFLLVATALGLLAVEWSGGAPPQWSPWAALIAGMACTVALGIALRADLMGKPSFVPEVVFAIGSTFSLLMAFSLRSRRELAVQRDLLSDALELREKALAERAWLAAIVESSGEAIVGVGLDSVIVVWNQAAEQLYGFTAAEIMGRRLGQTVPADRVEEVAKIQANVLAGVGTHRLRTERLHKDGRRLNAEIDVSPVRASHG